MIVVGGIVVLLSITIPLTSITQGTISIERVSTDKYVASLTSAEPNTQYNLEFTILIAVNPTWEYGGVFLTDSSGSLTTFEINLPSSEYPSTFRFRNSVTGIATYNTVTIDPNNPPPLDIPVSDDTTELNLSYVTFLGLGTAAIGAVVTTVQSKKLKLPH